MYLVSVVRTSWDSAVANRSGRGVEGAGDCEVQGSAERPGRTGKWGVGAAWERKPKRVFRVVIDRAQAGCRPAAEG